jgi:hypothetical protein
MHPSVPRAYIPEYNPDDYGDSPINPTGLLHLLSPGSGKSWSRTPSPFLMYRRASRMAFARSGAYAIFSHEVNRRVIDPNTGNPVTRVDDSEFFRMSFDKAGLPLEASPPLIRIEAGMINDVAVGPADQILYSRFVVDAAGNFEYRMGAVVRDRTGKWVECLSPTALKGEGDFAVP